MYDKNNENYGLYLAGLINEHEYYDLCEGKKLKAKDVNGDGKIDFIDILASRMMASGMSKEEAIKKAESRMKKNGNKKKKKKKKSNFHEEVGLTGAAKTRSNIFFTALEKMPLTTTNVKLLVTAFVAEMHAKSSEINWSNSKFKMEFIRAINEELKKIKEDINPEGIAPEPNA